MKIFVVIGSNGSYAGDWQCQEEAKRAGGDGNVSTLDPLYSPRAGAGARYSVDEVDLVP